MTRLRGAGASALLVFSLMPLVLQVPAVAAAPVAPAPGTLTTFAGGFGAGPATNLSTRPIAVAVGGGRIFTVDGSSAATDLPAMDSLYPGLVRSVDVASGITSVVAGNGAGAFSGDGGPATQASFGTPSGVAVDGAGNLYISDGGNNRVRRVSTSGIVTTIAGNGASGFSGDGGPATGASLYGPGDLAIGADGSVVFADTWNFRVRRIDPSGIITTIAGTGPPGPGQPEFAGDGGLATDARLSMPKSVALDLSGAVLIADFGNHRVRRVGALGIITTIAGNGSDGASGDGGQATAAAIAYPWSVDVDAAGRVYILAGNQVRRIDDQGMISTIAGGNAPGFSGDGGPATAAGFNDPRSIAVDPSGVVYLADSGHLRIRKIDTAGTISTIAGNGFGSYGGDGGPARSAQLSHVGALASRPEGLLVSDRGNERLRLVDQAGTITTSKEPAPFVMAFDAQGNTFTVAGDTGQQVIKTSPSGVVTPVAGTSTAGFSGDGGLATAAQLHFVSGLAFDGGGNLYISDSENNRIRRVDPAGTITTFAGDGSGWATTPTLATKTGIQRPRALTVDRDGSLYILQDWGSLLKVKCGMLSGVVGAPAGGRGIVVDGARNIFVSGSEQVWKTSPDATQDTVAGGGTALYADGVPGPSAKLRWPGPLSIDAAGNLYVADVDRVYRVERAAVPAPAPGIACPLPDRPSITWGWNGFGALGDGSTTQRSAPDFNRPATLQTKAVAGGGYHSLAVREDGSVWSWGYNGLGQLGDGTSIDRRAPVRVAGLTNVKAVAAGVYHSLALKTDGTVWAWGWNGVGQLGDSTAQSRLVPVRVASLSSVTQISAGYYHSLALRSDGTAWAWGYNEYGQLGDGTVTHRMLPRRIGSLTGVTAVSGGAVHTLAISNGAVWGVGGNWVGQLGDGTVIERHSPVKIPGLTGVTRVAAGGYHSLLAVSDQNVRAWGWNMTGQVGDGTTTDRHSPVLVISGRVSGIAAGAYHSLEILDGSILAHGWNGYGQLGNGMPSDYVGLGRVEAFTGATSVAAGAFHSLAIWEL